MSIFSIKRLDRVLATACLSVTASSHVLATLDPKDVLTQLSPAEIEAQLPNEHPSNYYLYAGRLMKAGDKAGALRWFYIGQLRYRIYIKAHPGEDSSLFGSLNQMGTVLNRYGALHRDEWLGAIDAALAWDDTHINGPSPKEKFQSICDEQRAGLLKLKSYIVSNIDQLAAAASGREPMPTDWPTLIPITTAKDLEGVFGRWTVGSVTSVFFAVPPAGVNFFMEDELELKAISPSRLLVIVRGRKGELARTEREVTFADGAAIFPLPDSIGKNPRGGGSKGTVSLRRNTAKDLVMERDEIIQEPSGAGAPSSLEPHRFWQRAPLKKL